MKQALISLSFLFLLVIQTSVQAGQLTSENNAFCDWKFSGQIEKGDADKVARIPNGYFVTRLCLDSPGGSLAEGLKLFDLIWDQNFTTAVLPGDICESACAIAFLGGSTLEGTDVTRQMDRLLWRGSRIGFHGPSLNLATGQAYRDTDLNQAFGTAIAAAARLFEVNRTQDRGDRAMTDHLLHRWLNTEFSSMYFIDTVGDAILSDISVAGIDFDLQLTTDLVQNVCDNVYLKGSYPSGYGQSGTIHHDFVDAATTKNELDQDEYFGQDRKIFAEIRGDELVAFVGPYFSGTKYHVNGCAVTFRPNSTAGFKADDYYGQAKPVNVTIISYTHWPEDGVDVYAWVLDQDVLQERSLDPIYLFPFDMAITDLPTSAEYDQALDPGRTVKNDRESQSWVWTRLLGFSARDLPGADIGTVASGDINECAKACIGNPDCIGYTADRWNELCFLKGQDALASTLRIHPKADTYLRPEYAFKIAQDPRPAVMKGRKGKGFDGYAYQTLTLDSYDICAAQCLEDPECMAVNYHAAPNSCEKMSSPPEYFTMDGVEMGLKVQQD